MRENTKKNFFFFKTITNNNKIKMFCVVDVCFVVDFERL